MNIEDIEMIAKKTRDLQQSIVEGNTTNHKEIAQKLEAIKELADKKGIPFEMNLNDLLSVIQDTDLGVPEEYIEEESSEYED